MGILTDYQKIQIKAYRAKLYDTQIEARVITSAHKYGDSTAETYTSTTFNGRLAYDRAYFYTGLPGGIVEDQDLVITTSLDNKATITAPKTYLVVSGVKYGIGNVETYPDINEMIVRCTKIGG